MKKGSQKKSAEKAGSEGKELEMDWKDTKRKELEVKGKCIEIKGNEKKWNRWKWLKMSGTETKFQINGNERAWK